MLNYGCSLEELDGVEDKHGEWKFVFRDYEKNYSTDRGDGKSWVVWLIDKLYKIKKSTNKFITDIDGKENLLSRRQTEVNHWKYIRRGREKRIKTEFDEAVTK